MKLSKNQKQVLAEFFGNLAVVWLAGGVISPIIQKENLIETVRSGVIPLLWAIVLIFIMLYLTKGRR